MSISSNSPIRELKLTFSNFDSDNNGYIDKQALKSAIVYTGDNYDKNVISSEIDKCSDKITLAQFTKIFEMAEISRNQLSANQSLFRLYDIDDKGYIDEEDLKRVAEITGIQLSEEEIKQMLVSDEQEGRVRIEEFMEIMNDQNIWF